MWRCRSTERWVRAWKHHTKYLVIETDTLWNLFDIQRKSTFFNVLTKSQAAAENFPFCTIDPNESKTLVIIKMMN